MCFSPLPKVFKDEKSDEKSKLIRLNKEPVPIWYVSNIAQPPRSWKESLSNKNQSGERKRGAFRR
jgi:hypothetical protein